MYNLVAAVGPVFVCNLHPTLWFALLASRQVGDLPFAEVKPPENVLFVCKLNPVTRDEDLELIFSRFGPIVRCACRGAPCTASAPPSHVYRARRLAHACCACSAQVIRDYKSGESLCYAFIEFENKEDCEEGALREYASYFPLKHVQ